MNRRPMNFFRLPVLFVFIFIFQVATLGSHPSVLGSESSSEIALIHGSQLFDNAFDFNEIRPEDFLPAIQQAYKIAIKEIERIEDNPDAPTFENTVEAVELCCSELEQASQLFANYLSVNGSEELERVAPEVIQIWNDYQTRILFSQKLFSRIEHVWQKRNELNLNREKYLLLERAYKNLRTLGVNLPQDQQDQVRLLMSREQELSFKFAENVLKSETHTNFEITNPDDLKGLPSDVIAYGKQRAVEEGRPDSWIFSVAPHIFLAWSNYGESRYWREQFWRGRRMLGGIAPWDNTPIVLELVRNRAQRARLLGFSNFAELTLQDKMLRSPQLVSNFLNDLYQAVKAKAKEEFMELKGLAEREDGLFELRDWDIHYYTQKLKVKKFNVSREQFRPYFELNGTVRRTLEMLGSWFQIQFIPRDDLPVYHPDVRVYEVRDERSKEYLGLLYLDLIYRPNKKGGARMAVLRLPGQTKSGAPKRPHVLVVDEIMPPSNETPSLLSIGEVKTFFHEMGHALHALFSQVTYKSMSSSNVARDFIEFPSQLLENWVDQKQVLLQLGRHYQHGSQIPEELVDRWLASNKFNVSSETFFTLALSELDMNFHTLSVESAMSLEKIEPIEIGVMKNYRFIESEYFGSIAKSLGHLFAGGYAAGYYSYLWSNVLEADAFEFFKENGIYNRAMFDRFREKVLAKGALEDPLELYRDFRGRPPKVDAFLKRLEGD